MLGDFSFLLEISDGKESSDWRNNGAPFQHTGLYVEISCPVTKQYPHKIER